MPARGIFLSTLICIFAFLLVGQVWNVAVTAYVVLSLGVLSHVQLPAVLYFISDCVVLIFGIFGLIGILRWRILGMYLLAVAAIVFEITKIVRFSFDLSDSIVIIPLILMIWAIIQKSNFFK